MLLDSPVDTEIHIIYLEYNPSFTGYSTVVSSDCFALEQPLSQNSKKFDH
jgi:hypothetical protein